MRVRADMPPGHVRTPAYLRGKTGWVERTLGAFPNPEQRAYRHAGETRNNILLEMCYSELVGSNQKTL